MEGVSSVLRIWRVCGEERMTGIRKDVLGERGGEAGTVAQASEQVPQ